MIETVRSDVVPSFSPTGAGWHVVDISANGDAVRGGDFGDDWPCICSRDLRVH